MGRIYAVPISGVAVSAQQDIFELTAATGRHCAIHQIILTQSSEVGDAAEEGLLILLRRGTSGTSSGSGGTTPTPVPRNFNNGAAGFVAEINNTTLMSGGTITTEEAYAWNIRIPFTIIYPPELRPQIAAGIERKTIQLATTPADEITISGTLLVEEFG